VNARFAKPIDAAIVQRALTQCGFVLTVEEGTSLGGYGSAVLETAADAGWDIRHLRRLAIPDRFIEHATRSELLRDLGLDAEGIAHACLEMAERLDMLDLAEDAAPGVSVGKAPRS
jgi:1-deoxy-D-xylulose-5-phosphate synthase